MRVLIEECVDWRLSRDVIGHDVKTARQMGWATIKNGELLALAAQPFDMLVTVDRNLSFQQNLVTSGSRSGVGFSRSSDQAYRLGKLEFRAFQASRRSGEIVCRLVQDHVELAGLSGSMRLLWRLKRA